MQYFRIFLNILMKLTKEEYSMFNLSSRLNILNNDGVLLFKRVINAIYEAKVFLLYDFYVEVYYNRKKNIALKAEPLWNDGIVNAFLDTAN